MSAKPNYWPGQVIYDGFNTFTATTGSPGTLANGVLQIVRNGGAASTATGGSLTMDAGGTVGCNYIAIDTSDGSFYLGGCDYLVRLSAGSVGTIAANGLIVARFSLSKQASDARMVGNETLTWGAGGTASIGSKGTVKVALEDGSIKSVTLAADGVTRLQNGLATTADVATITGWVNRIGGSFTVLSDGTLIFGSLTTAAAGSLRTAIGIASANLDTQLSNVLGYANRVGGTFSVLADGTLVIGSATTAAQGTIRTAVGLASANLDTQLTAIDDYLDTEVAAIKAKTDNLPSDPADQSLIIAATNELLSWVNRIGGTFTPLADGTLVVGSVAANAIGTASISTAGKEAIADALLGRNVAGGSNGTRTVSQAMFRLRNRNYLNAGVLYIYETDDNTVSWQAAVTTAASNPPSDINPT